MMLLPEDRSKDEELIIGTWQLISDTGRFAIIQFEESGVMIVGGMSWASGEQGVFEVDTASYDVLDGKLVGQLGADRDTLELVSVTKDSLVVSFEVQGKKRYIRCVPFRAFNLGKSKEEIKNAMVHQVFTLHSINDTSLRKIEFLDYSKYLMTYESYGDTFRQINSWDILEYAGSHFLLVGTYLGLYTPVFQITNYNSEAIELTGFIDWKKIDFTYTKEEIHSNKERINELVGKWESTWPDSGLVKPPVLNTADVEFEFYEFFSDSTFKHQLHYSRQKGRWIMNIDQTMILTGKARKESDIILIKKMYNDTLVLSFSTKFEGNLEREFVKVKEQRHYEIDPELIRLFEEWKVRKKGKDGQ